MFSKKLETIFIVIYNGYCNADDESIIEKVVVSNDEFAFMDEYMK